ncbi:MAG TPA: glutamyl-tRNA reductase [Thermoanaerobaculia bacterium]|nr:glutamyl-tRNA reductase [Thermoanaerobaculia bacterium]
MSLALVGVNHKTAPVEVRERLSVSERELGEELSVVSSMEGVDGAAILSTCNRMEIVASVQDENIVDEIVRHIARRASMEREEVERHFYLLRHGDVVRHLFRVAAGLDSMIVGEPQIAGQVRASYQTALSRGSLDPMLHKLYEQTLRVAKKIRTETGIGEHAVSVPYAALELATKIFGKLDGLQILLIGAGKMGELTAQYFQGQGLKKVFVANRAWDRAQELAGRFGGTAIHFDGLVSHLAECDIVVASTAAPHYLVKSEDVEKAMARRRRRDLFLVDLAVPRNLDPEIATIEGAYLYNIDDLREIASGNLETRMQKAEQAEKIITREADTFLGRLASQEAVPTILELQARLEEIRATELERCLRKLGPITPEQRASIEMLSSGIINKVLHYPILRLKEATSDPKPESGAAIRETIRRIFGLR